jgi:hypothetical protein
MRPESQEQSPLPDREPGNSLRPSGIHPKAGFALDSSAFVGNIAVPPPAEFTEITGRSVANERAILRNLQSDLDLLLKDIKTLAQLGETSIESRILRSIEGLFAPYVPTGTSAPSAAATLASWCEPFLADVTMVFHPDTNVLGRHRDQLALRYAAERLGRLHEIFSSSDVRERRLNLEAFCHGVIKNAERHSSFELFHLALIDVAANLAPRTLDISPLTRAIVDPCTYYTGLHGMEILAQETLPVDQASVYSNPEAVRVARETAIRSIWAHIQSYLKEKDADSARPSQPDADGKELSGTEINRNNFYRGFTAMIQFGEQAVPYFREFFRLVKSPDTGSRNGATASKVRPHRVITGAVLKALTFGLGPNGIASFVQTENARPIADLTSPMDIIEDVIRLTYSTTNDSELQVAGLKFLAVTARNDLRVRERFHHLDCNLQQQPTAIRMCFFDSTSLERVISVALNQQAPDVQADAVASLGIYLKRDRDATPDDAALGRRRQISSTLAFLRAQEGLRANVRAAVEAASAFLLPPSP